MEVGATEVAAVATMKPELAPEDGIWSILVVTTMPFELPAVAAPTFKPVKVIVTIVLAAIV